MIKVYSSFIGVFSIQFYMSSNRYDINFLSNESFFKQKNDIINQKLYGTTPTPKMVVDKGYTYPEDMPDYLGLSYDFYDSNNYNVLYHEEKAYKAWDESSTYNTYNPYGYYKYGSSTYVPSYEDSVYLSRAHGVRKTRDTKPDRTKKMEFYPIEDKHDQIEFGVFDSKKPTNPPKKTRAPTNSVYFPTPKRGNITQDSMDFCKNIKLTEDDRDDICKKMSTEKCMESPCCVSIGKNKCVYGDETGPWIPSNYSTKDSSGMTMHQDFYYYQNKCYGNCRDWLDDAAT
jgi:hypothetical protein